MFFETSVGARVGYAESVHGAVEFCVGETILAVGLAGSGGPVGVADDAIPEGFEVVVGFLLVETVGTRHFGRLGVDGM